jgi:hypothetical protein
VDYDEPLEIHRSLDTQINADLVYCWIFASLSLED